MFQTEAGLTHFISRKYENESPFHLCTFGPVCWNFPLLNQRKKSLPLILVVFASPLIPTSLLLRFNQWGQTWSLTRRGSREGDLHPVTSTKLQKNALLKNELQLCFMGLKAWSSTSRKKLHHWHLSWKTIHENQMFLSVSSPPCSMSTCLHL